MTNSQKTMTTSQKLWLGFGTLTVLLVLVCALVLVRVRSIEANVVEQSHVARPRSAAARDLEINVVGFGLAVRTFTQTDDPKFRTDAEQTAADVEQHLSEYERLARTDQQREFAARFAALWREFKDFGTQVLNSKDRPLKRDDSEHLAELRISLQKFLDDELQPDTTRSHDASRDASLYDVRTIQVFILILLAVGGSIALVISMVVGRAIVSGERVIAEQGERLRTTLASIGDGVIATDTEGRITQLNPVAESLTGWTNAEALGQPLDAIFRIVHEDSRQLVENPATKALKEGIIVGLANHTILIAKDGTERFIDDSAAPIRCKAGEIVGGVLVFRDITERKRAENALREGEARFRQMIDALPAAVYTVDAKGKMTHFNPAAVEFAGRVPVLNEDDWCVNKKLFQLDGTPLPLDQNPMALAIREGRTIMGIEAIAERPDGTRRWGAPHATPLRNSAGEIIGGINMIVDISERKQAEVALCQSNQQLVDEARALAKLSELSSRLWRVSSFREGLNEMLAAVIELLGADMGNVQILEPDRGVLMIEAQVGFKQDFLDFFREVSTVDESACGRTLRSGVRTVIEDVETDAPYAPLRPVARAAGYRAVQTTPLIGRDGKPLGMLSTHFRSVHRPGEQELARLDLYVRQATGFIERKQDEAMIRERDERYRTLFDIGPVAVYSCDASGVIRNFNSSAVKLWRRTPAPGDTDERFCGSHKMYRPDGTHMPHGECPMVDVLSGAIPDYDGEVHFEHPDGSRTLVIVSLRPMKDERGAITGAINCFYDISERKQAEVAARHRSEQVQRLAEVATRLNTLHDVPSIMGIVNEEARSLIGSHQAVSSMTVNENWQQALVAISFSDKYARWRGYDEKPDGSGIYSLVCRTNKPMRLTQTELEAHPAWKAFGRHAPNHPPLRGWLAVPFTGLRQGNVGLIQVSDKSEGEFTEDDEAVLVQLAQMASVAIENSRLAEVLRDADRRKDEFLATLAHELRNPLAPVRNAVEILRMKSPDIPELHWATEIIDRQTQAMARLIDDLMDISRINQGKMELKREQVELAKIVQGAVETSRPLIESMGHELTVTLPPGPVIVDADLTRLAQVFLNLLNNAAKYTERGGRIDLRAELQGSDVVVSVTDTGIGIPADKLPTLFQMFSQVEGALSRSQGGLGIGLCLVKRLVELHGGSIEAKSGGPGQGSEFVVRLPIVVTQTYPRQVSDDGDKAQPTSGLRILVVDDNRDAAETLAMLLKMMGNNVHTAHDGEEAVAAAGKYRPHVVLCDIGLPKLNGYEACRQMKVQAWDEKMILIAVTGWGKDGDRRKSEEAGFDHHLVKPVDPQALMKLLAGLGSVKA